MKTLVNSIFLSFFILLSACADNKTAEPQDLGDDVNLSGRFVEYLAENLAAGTYDGSLPRGRFCRVVVQVNESVDEIVIDMFADKFEDDPASTLRFHLGVDATKTNTMVTETGLRLNYIHTEFELDSESGKKNISTSMLSLYKPRMAVEAIYIEDPSNQGESLSNIECEVESYSTTIKELDPSLDESK